MHIEGSDGAQYYSNTVLCYVTEQMRKEEAVGETLVSDVAVVLFGTEQHVVIERIPSATRLQIPQSWTTTCRERSQYHHHAVTSTISQHESEELHQLWPPLLGFKPNTILTPLHNPRGRSQVSYILSFHAACISWQTHHCCIAIAFWKVFLLAAALVVVFVWQWQLSQQLTS